jgi:adenylate cyclase
VTGAQQRLLDDMRDALLAPVDAIVSTSMLLDNAGREVGLDPTEFEDLRKIRAAATELYSFVKDKLHAEHFPAYLDEPGVESEMGTIRHDIKNRLNHIMGPCQFLILDHDADALSGDLREVLRFTEQCLKVLNASVNQTAGTRTDVVGHDLKNAEELARPVIDRSFVGSVKREVEPASILVADDNATNREILARFLERHNHTVTFACDGRETLDLIRERTFDLVLLDILMPEINGFQVLENMRQTGHLRHTPVIVLTGLDGVADAVRCIEIGAEDFLSRPVHLDLLKARVDACLEKKRLREQLYEQFFTPELAREIVRHPDLLEMEGKKAEVSVLFCDVRKFSTISERLGPIETISWLRDVMGILSDSVMRYGGVLVDYTGDELMAMWGAPEYEPNHAQLACTAAIEMLSILPEFDTRWEASVQSKTAVGIGINTGEVFVGNVGTRRKFKYGPLGNTVNLASRVQGATKYLRSEVLITGQTKNQLSPDARLRRLCTVKVNNILEPVELYELATLGRENWTGLKEAYELALFEFERQNFTKASSILGNIFLEYPNDGPSLLLMSRAVSAMLDESAPFDPVWELPGK